MTPEQVMSRCYEHGQPDYVLAADTIKALLAAQPATSPLRGRVRIPEWRDYAETLDEYIRKDGSAYSLALSALIEVLENIETALASPPEQAAPLRGRESVREVAHKHCTCTCRDDPAVLQNHTNLCDEISDAILEYAALFSAAPEQPTALPLAVRLRDEAGPPLPQMIAQRRAQLSQEQPAAPAVDDCMPSDLSDGLPHLNRNE